MQWQLDITRRSQRGATATVGGLCTVAVCSLQTIGVHTPTPIPVVNHAIYIQPYPVTYPYGRISVEKECLAAI